jgi:hypothetical protein
MQESKQPPSTGDDEDKSPPGADCGEYPLGDILSSKLDLSKVDDPNVGEVGADFRLYVAEGGEREERAGGGVFEIRWSKPNSSPLNA